jgi:hypothetical protein
MTTTGDHVSTTTTADQAYLRRAGLAGRVAGILFPTMIVVTTAFEWHYMHDQWGWRLTKESQAAYPSGLSTGPLGFLQIANFAVTGLLVLVLGLGLVRTLERGASRIVTRFGFGIMGLALMTSAFPTDFFYRPMADHAPVSWHGWIHDVSFYVLMLLGVLPSTIAFAISARRTPHWRRWALPTLLVPAALFASLFGVVPAPWGFYLLILVWMGWIAAAGHRLRRLG